jgi:hypothetical protein
VPNHTEVVEQVIQHHTTLFGVDGNGGLVREVDSVKATVAEHEKKIAAVSLKWLILMGLVGIAGNALTSTVIKTLQALQ